MAEIDIDELGRFWVYDDDGNPYGGPFDTPALAIAAHPEAEHAKPAVQRDEQAASLLRRDISAVLNRHSKENGSNTPDWILADYLMRCLDVFDITVAAREKWYGRDPKMVPPWVSTDGSAVQIGDPQCP